MFYYPQFLSTLELVNIQVVIPGGWGENLDSNKGLHFLWEHLLFAPTANIKDVDAWLWEHTLDFWSVTSYESIRLNFTLKPQHVEEFTKTLAQILKPRAIDPRFATKELHDLKNYWRTERDEKEDQVIRTLFKDETVVHPNPNLINDLSLDDIDAIQTLWQAAEPFLIVLGNVGTNQAVQISQLSHKKTKFKTQSTYQPPATTQHFFTNQRWGLKAKLNGSHIFELLLIELWVQKFGQKFFFEYHLNQMFVWTDDTEHPQLLAQKIKNYTLTQTDFNHAKNAYLKFLETLYTPANSQNMEKLAELTEGLHAHQYQSPTYFTETHSSAPLSLKGEDEKLFLNKYFEQIKYSEFKTFYEEFLAKL